MQKFGGGGDNLIDHEDLDDDFSQFIDAHNKAVKNNV